MIKRWISLICETDGCKSNGKIVNEVELPSGDVDQFMEAHGHGGEEEHDYCPDCKKLGVAQDPRPPSCICGSAHYPCPKCKELICQDCEDTHTCDPE